MHGRIPEITLVNLRRAHQKKKLYFIKFVLFFREERLKPGDCGAVIYKESDLGTFTPLGILVGAYTDAYYPSASEKGSLYIAVVLGAAFKDFELDYPKHIRKLTR